MKQKENNLKTRRLRGLLISLAVAVVLFVGAVLAVGVLGGYSAGETSTEVCRQAVDAGAGKYIIFEPKAETDENFPKTGIIFYPGAKVPAEAYAPLMEQLSEDGALTITVKMPLKLALFGIHKAEDAMALYPEIENWYLGGHSLGGAMAARYLTKNSEKYKGLFLFGSFSADDLSGTDLSVLSLYGDKDGVLNRESYEENKKNYPKDFTEIVIPGGNHAGYADYGPQIRDMEATITKEEQQQIVAEEMEKWMQNQ